MTCTRSGDRAAGPFARGAAYAVAAVTIWAGWIVVMRVGVTTTLSAPDLAALRFGVAGTVLLPIIVRRGVAFDRLGWVWLIALSVGGGAPMVLLVGAGLIFAPAAHGGALFPGVMPLFVALLAAAALKERLSPPRIAGLVLILCGVLAITGLGMLAAGGTQSLGHLLFICAAVLWAGYTVAIRRARLDGLHAAAIASVASMAVYLPVYAVFLTGGLPDAPLADIVFQGVYQGVLTMIVSLFFYGRAVHLLGASGAAAFGALGPAIATLIAIPVLGEIPIVSDWIGIVLISAGVYLASGAPLRRRREA